MRPLNPSIGEAACAASILVCALVGAAFFHFGVVDNLWSGEMLIHGIWPRHPPEHMPLRDIVHALVWAHPGPLGTQFWILAQSALLGALIGALGALAGSAAAGLAATAWLTLCWPAWNGGGGGDERSLYLLISVLLVAGLLVWRARAPTTRRTLDLALAIGCSFLYRSVLVLFPVVLAGWELLRRGPDFKRKVQAALILGIVPYLFLTPWIWTNWRMGMGFVPFERGEAELNVVEGALGQVKGIDADFGVFKRTLTTNLQGDAVMSWAVREVLAHPFRYIHAYGKRVDFFISINRRLCGFALAGVVLLILLRRREALPVSGLAAYLVIVHCLMTVEGMYFIPIWPLAAVLAFLGAAAPFRRPVDGDKPPAAATALLLGTLACALALSLFAMERVFAQGLIFPATGEEKLDAQLRHFPSDAWLLSLRAQRHWRHDEQRAAVSDSALAAALMPDDPYFKNRLIGTLAKMGDRRFRENDARWDDPGPGDAEIVEAIQLLRRGREGEARRRLLHGWILWRDTQFMCPNTFPTEIDPIEIVAFNKLVEHCHADFGPRVLVVADGLKSSSREKTRLTALVAANAKRWLELRTKALPLR